MTPFTSLRSSTMARLFTGGAVIAGAATVMLARAQGPGEFGGRGPGGLSSFAIFQAVDTNHDNALSAAEVAASTTTLRALDKNADGRVSADELPAMPSRGPAGFGGRGEGREGFGGRGRGRGDEPGETAPTSPDELVTTLMAFDRNGDGKLAKDELPERLQGMFDRADANKDGSLSTDELKTYASAQAQPANDMGRGRGEGREGRGEGREGRGGRGFGPGRDEFISALDTNNDNTLSSDELATAPATLKRFDRDGDGNITPEELFAFGRGGRGGRG